MKNKPEKPFIQVWDYILDNDELDLADVLLLSKVISLDQTKDRCYMTNEYICKMLRLKHIETASRRINKLEKLGYVELQYMPLPSNPNKTKRYIVPTYENGLTQKSSRVDLKVKGRLTQESMGIDFKVNGGLTLESRDGCLESQSIISEYNTTYKNSSENKVQNISSTKSGFDEKQYILSLLEEKFEDGLVSILTTVLTGGYLTKKTKDILNENRDVIVETLPALDNYINEYYENI